MELKQTPLGYEVRVSGFTIFFGSKNSQINALKIAYPELQMIRVRQTHSDFIVESKDLALDYKVEADSHFSNSRNLALLVSTADCLPVFFVDKATNYIAGVHAGWRGVANRIVPKTIAALKKKGVQPKDLTAYIGPHIQLQSFEVELEVKNQILDSLKPLAEQELQPFFESKPNSRFNLDLNLVMRTQLQQCEIQAENFFDLHLDTFTNTDFHSYRRDKGESGRQISFVCRMG